MEGGNDVWYVGHGHSLACPSFLAHNKLNGQSPPPAYLDDAVENCAVVIAGTGELCSCGMGERGGRQDDWVEYETAREGASQNTYQQSCGMFVGHVDSRAPA